MRTAREIALLAREAFTLWRRNYLQLAALFCLGFGLHTLGQQLSARLGSVNQLLATLVFVLGVLGWLAGLIAMINALKPGLWTPGRLTDEAKPPLWVPTRVFRYEPSLDVLTSAVGPFLAVYAVWGFVEDEVADLVYVNFSQRSFDVDYWSISFDPERAPFYTGIAIVSWILGKIIKVAGDRIGSRPRTRVPAKVLEVIADGTFVFALFMALATWSDRAQEWWQTRQVAGWLAGVRRTLIEALPDLQLWSDLTLPEVIDDGLDWCWQVLLPGTADRLLLPLMWLALTATVFGWREFRGREAVSGTRLDPAARRIGRWTPTSARSGPTGAVLLLATDDLRTKYIPVITALRMLWRAGPWFLAGYLILATALTFAEDWFGELLTVLVGPTDRVETIMALDPFLELITGLIFTTFAIALYAAAFDRAMAEVTGVGRTTRPTAPVSVPPGAGNRPSTTA